MHAIETYRFWGAPYCFTMFLILSNFRPLLLYKIDYFAYFDNRLITQIHILINSKHVSLILLDSYNQSRPQPKHRPPVWLQRPTNTEPATTWVCWMDIVLNSHPQCAPVLPKNILKNDPERRVNKNTSIWIKKSHGRSRDYTKYMKIYIQNHRKLRHQELAPHILGSHALPFHAIEGTWVWKVMLFLPRIETSREQKYFRDAHPGRTPFSQHLRWYPKYIRSELFPLWKKNRGCDQQKRSVLGVDSKIS